MNKKQFLMMTFLVGFVSNLYSAEAPVTKPFDNVSHSSEQDIYTYDMPITSEQIKNPEGEDYVEVLDGFPYKTIRTQGSLVQIQYSVGAFGKAQWFILSDLDGVVLMPNSINLPVGKWIKNGLKEGAIMRVIISVPKETKGPSL